MESAQIGQLAADGLIDTGTLVASPGFNSKPRRRNGRLSIDVYPQGIHHDTPNGPVRNAEVAFIHEFGAPARGIKATQSMRKATERAAADVTEAERQVYEAWLYRLNL